MKRAIRYLRFSQLGQSNGSIERQEMYTDQYIKYNNLQLVDTFIDRGKSAKTFDRPDFIKLQAFIAKHYRSVDFLLVDQLDRFSRDAGEAMNMVKQFQRKYNIQIVSVTEGITFDYDTPGSFFRAGLQLLLAEEDNINRSIKVRGGLYTARAKEGRFLTREKPFGYIKVGEGKNRHLEIVEKEAAIIREVYDLFLRDVPLYKIKQIAYEKGFDRKGNMAIERVLANPVYAALVRVEPFKDMPGGIFPASHEPIIDKATWQLVQSKLKKPDKIKVVVDDELPLRGVLKCHCGTPLTGAPSRGKSGKYFYYYKCKHSGHNNISAIKAHEQFLNICKLMSIPEKRIMEIRESCYNTLKEEMKTKKGLAKEKQKELDEIKRRLSAVEEKWINNEINKDTYDRWYSTYSEHIVTLSLAVERLSISNDKVYEILDRNLDMLSDIGGLYEKADTLRKRDFVKMVFDSNLYYENGIYRTPTMLELLSRNASKMEGKGYLIYNKKRDNLSTIPQSGR